MRAKIDPRSSRRLHNSDCVGCVNQDNREGNARDQHIASYSLESLPEEVCLHWVLKDRQEFARWTKCGEGPSRQR